MKRTHITLHGWRVTDDPAPWIVQVSRIEEVITAVGLPIQNSRPEANAIVYVKGSDASHPITETIEQVQALIDGDG